MMKKKKSDQENSTKTKNHNVAVIGSSIVYRNDNKNVNGRFTTLYGPNSPGRRSQATITSEGFFAYTHPEFESRPRRLDLVSNRLNRVQLKISGNSGKLCDISSSGFSYAQRLSKIPGDYYQIKKAVASSEKRLVGRKIEVTFQSNEEKAVDKINICGTVRNVKLIYGLHLSEVEIEFKKFLYRKTITRNNDKFDAYAKLEYLVELVKAEMKEGNWSEELAVSVNTTILNMMMEIGTTDDAIDKIYENYKARPRFIRFGVEVDTKEQAEELQSLTHSISSIYREKIKKEKRALKDAKEIGKTSGKMPRVPVGLDFSFQKFLLKAWYGCLARFKLDYRTEKLKSSNKNLAKHLKREAMAFDDALNRLPEKKPGQINLKATELLIAECIKRGLYKRENEKYEHIEADIHVIVCRTFDICIREYTAKLKT